LPHRISDVSARARLGLGARRLEPPGTKPPPSIGPATRGGEDRARPRRAAFAGIDPVSDLHDGSRAIRGLDRLELGLLTAVDN